MLLEREPDLFRFADDGETPNHPRFPLLVYRGAVDLSGARDPAAIFEALFARNGWPPAWRNGVYGYRHFHPHAHEALGVARGTARVEFGGAKGAVLDLQAGDAAVLPAGTGHEGLSASADLVIVGAYPVGTHRMAAVRPSEIDHAEAVRSIGHVPAPAMDPIFGDTGPLVAAWR
jgi:uncharacterized protein YjlB